MQSLQYEGLIEHMKPLLDKQAKSVWINWMLSPLRLRPEGSLGERGATHSSTPAELKHRLVFVWFSGFDVSFSGFLHILLPQNRQ